MKIYKFRGKDIETGKIIYGDLIHSHSHEGKVLINEENHIATPARYVYPDSVAHFIGYDKNGKEIYSNDKIKNYRYTLDGKGVCTQKKNAADFFRISDIGKTFDNIELVEKN